jgi:glycylpeptide N-tetradecanoyltransferase
MPVICTIMQQVVHHFLNLLMIVWYKHIMYVNLLFRLSLLLLFFKNDFDVFNALDLMDNREFLEKLKFGVGDGNLQYYIYNWKCTQMAPEKVYF